MKKTRISALMLAVLLLVACIGCAASTKEAADEAYYNTAESPAVAVAYDEVKQEMMLAEEAGAVTATEAAEYEAAGSETFEQQQLADGEESVSDFTAKIIYSAELELQTTQFDNATAVLERLTSEFGGFIEQSNISGDISYNSDGTTEIVNRRGYYCLRIPCQRFEEFLSQTQGLCNVLSSRKYAENVTSTYTDYEARLSSLNTQQDRLLAMLEQSEDVESLIALEQRLADVRYELESIERNLRNLDMQISYSTVNIDLQEVEVYTPSVRVQRSFGEKLSDAFSDGWKSFTRSIQRFLIGLAESLPTLILLAVIAVVCVLLVRRAVKKRRAKRSNPDTDEQS